MCSDEVICPRSDSVNSWVCVRILFVCGMRIPRGRKYSHQGGFKMLFLRKPTEVAITQFLAQQSRRNLTYSTIGATAGHPPAGFVVDHIRIKLGDGAEVFEAALHALRRWEQFQLSWLEAVPNTTSIEEGHVVAVVAHAAGLWWLNACRIILVINEAGPVVRFGFAYGTLPDHAESGEERFLIEWDRSDNSVWYDILAFSRPQHILAKIGYPVVRAAQKRFGRESCGAMLRAVKAQTEASVSLCRPEN